MPINPCQCLPHQLLSNPAHTSDSSTSSSASTPQNLTYIPTPISHPASKWHQSPPTMSKSQPPASTIPPQTQDGIHEKPPIDKGMSVASFDGSFAPLVRPTVRRTIPWYKDREYFLGGWTNPSIWKAAVNSPQIFLLSKLNTSRSSKQSPLHASYTSPSSQPPRYSATTPPN